MIRFDDVSFAYAERQDAGIRNVDLTIRRGECVLLCGRSGCGKTTLTRLVNGLIPMFYAGTLNGSTTVDGTVVQELPMYELATRVGSVFQNPRSQFFNVDTDSEMAFGMENLTCSRSYMKQRIAQTVQALDMEELLGRSVFDLSGGEKQKVAFASIYAMNPDVYLLDEPSSNLDTDAIDELRRILAVLKAEGKTILIAEHRIYYLRDLADRIVYMEDGAISAVYTADAFAALEAETRQRMGLRAYDLRSVTVRAQVQTAEESVLDIKDLSLYWQKRCILDKVSLSAGAGEIIGIVGHNGAGKSTFSRTLCGLHANGSGEIYWRGQQVDAKERLKLSYMVMQDVGYQLFADTVEKECVFGIKHPDQEAADHAIHLLALDAYRLQHPNTLSGGQKQRLAVAVSVVCRKELLIFDEPTSGLDYDSMMQVVTILRMLAAMGKIIFVVTHDYEFLTAACSRVIHFDEGRLQEDYLLNEASVARLQEFFFASQEREKETGG